MFRVLLVVFVTLTRLLSFETTNVQYLYSNSFDGDSFIYDTKDGKKTTITFEHYRTFSFGDFFMFVDALKGEKFDGSKNDVYVEMAPRLSFSKILNTNLSFGVIKDIYIAAQVNMGHDYEAYLGGFGVDIDMLGFEYFNLNIYYKTENIESDTIQATSAYRTKEFAGVHFEGYIDLTKRDVDTHDQLLYNLNSFFSIKEQVFVGVEWIYYRYKYNSNSSKTSALQAMVKYQF